MSLQSDLITDLEEKLSKTSLPFTPISADEDQIHSKEIQNGNLYFATDSGRIYLDMMNERKSFGG
jgi:hypothetical protein